MALSPTGAFSTALGSIRGAADKVLSNDPTGAVNEIFRGSVTGKRKAKPVKDTGTVIGKTEVGKPITDPSLPYANKHLLANLFLCDKHGVQDSKDKTVITAPAFDVNLDVTLNWHSQFESMNMDNFKPSLMAMIQSGEIGTAVQGLQALSDKLQPEWLKEITGGQLSKTLGEKSTDFVELAKQLEGMTGITKLNSRQVFAGMPPIKITLSMAFRAFHDAVKEVQEPTNTILQWALPKRLANDGLTGRTDANSVISALFPSEAPAFVGLVYGRNRYAPLVIEGAPVQLDGPITSDGVPAYRVVQLTLATLTALDRNDLATKILGFSHIGDSRKP